MFERLGEKTLDQITDKRSIDLWMRAPLLYKHVYDWLACTLHSTTECSQLLTVSFILISLSENSSKRSEMSRPVPFNFAALQSIKTTISVSTSKTVFK